LLQKKAKRYQEFRADKYTFAVKDPDQRKTEIEKARTKHEKVASLVKRLEVSESLTFALRVSQP
jgi:hypothetical protein